MAEGEIFMTLPFEASGFISVSGGTTGTPAPFSSGKPSSAARPVPSRQFSGRPAAGDTGDAAGGHTGS